MYSTCLHCNASLRRNVVVEHFPVGRRLAFDGAKGRLWVICPVCERWNLTPVEERWEAIEECERLFQGTRLRTSTEHIGLARAAGGLDLIRIGKPLRHEIAAWRYGSALQRRWKSHWRMFAAENTPNLTAASTLGTVLYLGSGSAIVGMVSSGVSIALSTLVSRAATRDIRTRIVLPDGQVTDMRSLALSGVSMTLADVDDGGWTLRSSRGGKTYYSAEHDAAVTLRGVLAYRNAAGGDAKTVSHAVDRLVASGDARTFINRVARAARTTGVSNFTAYPAEVLLALEMALHDDGERRAMEGALAALAAEWELAEEVAKIADDMFLPDAVRAKFAALTSQRRQDQG